MAEGHFLTEEDYVWLADRSDAARDGEAAIARVRHEVSCWSFLDDESVTVDELRDRVLAALDGTKEQRRQEPLSFDADRDFQQARIAALVAAQRSERSEEQKSIDEEEHVIKRDGNVAWCRCGWSTPNAPPVPSGTGEQPEES